MLSELNLVPVGEVVELLGPALHLALEVDQLPHVVRVHVLHARGAHLRFLVLFVI